LRIDIWAAVGLGILLPTLETIRRGFDHWTVGFTTMFEDYVAGIGLLVAAIGILRRARWATTWSVIIWSGVMFMMLISTVSQLERHFWSLDPEPRSGLVLAIKLALFAISVVALAQSVRALHRPLADRPERSASS
jgi:hypothetical protein